MPRDGDKCITCYQKVIKGVIKHLRGCPLYAKEKTK